MRRLVPALALALCLGATVAAPAEAAPKGPKRGAWTCENGGTEPFATFDLHKGGSYTVDGEDEGGDYVYKPKKKVLRFTSGPWHGVYFGEWVKKSKSLTLMSVESTGPEAVCTRDDEE